MTAALSAPTEITPTEFEAISRYLHQRTGIRLAPGKEVLVMGRLGKRLRTLGLHTYDEYLRLLSRPESEAESRAAIDLLTTNETYFFREPQHFDFLRQVVVPAHRAMRPFRLWSAASSSGEEAYSAAMVLADTLRDRPWEIVGTDISSRVVESAQRGIYDLTAAGRIPGALLRRYCRKGRDEYEGLMAVSPELRQRVTFRTANLLENLHQLGRFDVIMLRNVMIYFDAETKANLIGRLQAMLHPGGYLIVSLSETLTGISSDLRTTGPSIYRLGGQARG